MKKQSILDTMTLLAAPIGVCALGLVLIVSPDTISALMGSVLGIAATAAGAALVLSLLLGHRTVGKLLLALVLLIAGTRLLRNPLSLASGLGRFVGALLLLCGGQEWLRSEFPQSKAVCGLTALLGLVLLVLPMTTSRLVFWIIGAVLVVTGAAQILQRLRHTPRQKDDIIDAL